MNLPHLNLNLGPKSLRALTQPGAPIARHSGRQTGVDLMSAFPQDAPLPDPTSSWLTLQAQRKNLLSLPYNRLAQIALDLSPEVNKGLYDFLRFANPGNILRDRNGNERSESASLDFVRILNTYYGSFRSHLNSLWSGIFITGGAFPELVLGPGGRMPYDLVFNDPIIARFAKERHPIRGWRWRLYIDTLGGGRKYLDDNPLVKYVGFDRLTDNPYGRPIIGPAVHASLTLLSIIEILQKVIANQGLSRVDYEVDAEELLRLIDRNPDIAGDDAATAQFITEQIEGVKAAVKNLEIDHDYVHLSTVQVNYATGSVMSPGHSEGLSRVIKDLRLSVVNGMKGVSALSNLLDSTTETHIRSQLEYYVAAIQSAQNETGDMLGQFFTIGNQVQGIASEMEFLFLRQRTADKKASAEIRDIEVDTIIKKLDAGIIDPVEARDEVQDLKDELQVSV